jgi:anaerobic selenocysteine-containing dehydrogenase
MNLINNIIQNTRRGEPFVFLNDRDATEFGIENGERVKLVNDVGEILIAAKLTAACRPGQVKWLGLAAGYGHLQYRPLAWQPIPCDRAVRVDVEKLG